jgi:glucose/arabinose dehydrogenase
VLAAAAGLFAGGAVAGRHPAAPAKPRKTTVNVSLVDFRIRLSRASVPFGTVVFHVTNRGATVHDLVFPGRGRTRLLRPRQQQTIVVRFAKKGAYAYRCSVPGHAALGMKGVLRVGKVAPPATQPTTTTAPSASDDLKLTPVGDGFGPVTDVTAPPGDQDRLLVVQQDGLVVLLRDGVRQAAPFLDLRGLTRADGEKGLLSLAFAPDYATSGLLYVDYNDLVGNLHVVEYRRSAASADTVDPASARELLVIDKPTADHNGGMLQFGPDGDLYISVGDGGAGPGIPVGIYGQTLDDLLGDILRIDPRHGDPYAIPAGNPLVGTPSARPEIVAYGLRNPWRFWIDPQTNAMLIGDVGEGTREEIDRLPLDDLGLNFGWPCLEGTTTPPASIPKPASCATATLTPPLFEYAHSQTRCSIIGGPVAHDPRLPGLDGLFLWTDLCDDELYAIDPAQPRPSEIDLKLGVAQPTSFGTDALGRIYVTTLDGKLYRLDPAG